MTKKDEGKLSDEFKNEITNSHKKSKNVFGVLIASLAIILVFGTIGMAIFQILNKQSSISEKTAEEKIESAPSADDKVVQTPTPTPPPVATPAPTPVATQSSGEYTVVSGDVMGSIASKFNTTVAKLKDLNGITDENSLQIGQVLKVPK